MSARSPLAERLSWLLLAVLLPMAVATTVMQAQRPAGVAGGSEVDAGNYVYTVSQLAFLAAGVVIVRRFPRNATGWFFCAIALSGITGAFSYEYAVKGLVLDPGSLPLAREASLFYQLSATPIGGWFALAVMTFPGGNLLSRRWRWAAAVPVGGLIVVAVNAVTLWPYSGPQLLRATFTGDGIASVFFDLPYAFFVPGFLLAFAALAVRFKRSRGSERLQLKWFVLSVAFAIVGVFVGPFQGSASGEVIAAVGVLTIPFATAIAILKYRLYDIDVVINRTLVYGLLTAFLAATYFGSVVFLQRVLDPVTADSGLAVAASTLVVAALFRPLRTKIQFFIDRRFYRRKYDARKTLEEFSAHLRNEVELHALTAQLLGVVGETMQPRHLSLWLRSEGRTT